MSVSFDRVPPVWTQERFNTFLSVLETWINSGAAPANFVYPNKYIINNDGTVTTAYNAQGMPTFGGATDLNGVAGADAAAVIQTAIDDVYNEGTPPFGGNVYVRKGISDYSIGSSIAMRNRVNFLAEKDATLTASVDLPDGVISLVEDDATGLECEVAGFRLEGAWNEATPISTYGVKIIDAVAYLHLHDLFINSFTNACLYIGGSWGGTYRNIITQSLSGGYGFMLTRDDASHTGTNLTYAQYLYDHGAGTGMLISKDCDGNRFDNCHFTSTTDCVVVDSAHASWHPKNIAFRSCWFEEGTETTQKGVFVTNSVGSVHPRCVSIEDCKFGNMNTGIYLNCSEQATVRNCYFDECSNDLVIQSNANDTVIDGGYYGTYASVWDAGIRTQWRGVGFEASGVANISSDDTVTVTHGLRGTPDIVLAQVINGGTDARVWGISSTQFEIHTADEGTWVVAWYANTKGNHA